jgi:diguanylate cyclase (GGDEF)-like protein/PAS domain S-box-containing protein
MSTSTFTRVARPAIWLKARGFNAVEIALTALAFYVLKRLGLLSSTPYWVYLVLFAVSGALGAAINYRWGKDSRTGALHIQVAAGVLATTSVIYATGWGPTLVIGYMFVATDSIKRLGSRAAKPTLVWSAIGIFLGEMAIALHIAPSRFSSPAVHGLAVLAGLGAGFAIQTMGVATAREEEARAEVRRSEDRFRSLVQNASDVVAVVNTNGQVTYVSPSIRRLGFHADELVSLGQEHLTSLIHPDDIESSRAMFQQVLSDSGGKVYREELRLQHADGSWRWHEVNYTNLTSHPSVEGLVVNFHDITERREYEERLAHEARHDPLTGLPNRKSFLEQLGKALSRARRQRSGVTVIFVDLDRFKLINDSLGHNLGDRFLVEVARRLPTCVRPEDTVARLSGDEFTILVEDVSDPSAAMQLAERIAELFRQPVAVDSGELVVTASVGVAISPLGADSAEDLLCQSDLAMYAAKESGRARAVLFDRGATPQFVDRVELEAGLRQAIERDELELHYQPVVTLPDGALNGYEALLRWRHPGRGLLSPAAFIGLAEETGLIIPIGRWALRTACQALAGLHADGRPDLTMSVNVSAVQLHRPGFADDVASAVQEAGLAPERLVLEITESVLIRADATCGVLEELHDLGVKLALDDFGTGYSSLAYLRRLPLDFLKIDRSFVSHLDGQGADTAIVRAIVDLAHTLGLVTVGEGVETEEQAEVLADLGCVLAQGYLYAEPGPRPGLLAGTALS